MCRLAKVLAADTREPRLCAALRAYAVPSSGFVMQPHEDPLLAVGFLDFEQRGQFEARQAIVLGFAGECRCSRIVLGSLVSAVEDSGLQVRDGSAYMRLLEQLVSLPSRPPSRRRAQLPEPPELHCRDRSSQRRTESCGKPSAARDGAGVGFDHHAQTRHRAQVRYPGSG